MKPDPTGEAGARPARAKPPRKERRTACGRRIYLLVRGKGEQPAHDTLEWIAQDASADVREALLPLLREAMVQRSAHTADRLDAPVRHLEDPHARRVLALYLCIAEMTRHGVANSRALWHGHDRAGLRGGLAGRLGVSRSTVERMLDALCKSGVMKRWQAPKDQAGPVKARSGQCYQNYLLFVTPRSIARSIHVWYRRTKQRTSAPEATDNTASAPASKAPEKTPTKAPTTAQAPSAASARPSGRADGYDVHEALKRFAPFVPLGKA